MANSKTEAQRQRNPDAFPHREYEGGTPYENGMSLRDYFAGQVLRGRSSGTDDPAGTARLAYALADAMLVERLVERTR